MSVCLICAIYQHVYLLKIDTKSSTDEEICRTEKSSAQLNDSLNDNYSEDDTTIEYFNQGQVKIRSNLLSTCKTIDCENSKV